MSRVCTICARGDSKGVKNRIMVKMSVVAVKNIEKGKVLTGAISQLKG